MAIDVQYTVGYCGILLVWDTIGVNLDNRCGH